MNESPAQHRLTISLATVVMLVLLRLTIGWHFLVSGFEKFEPGWSSAPFLSQATGPLAGFYLAFVPDYHGWDALMAVPRQDPRNPYDPNLNKPGSEAYKKQEKQLEEQFKKAYEDWQTAVLSGWGEGRSEIENHYGFDKIQREKAGRIFDIYEAKLKDYLYQNHEELAGYRHDLFRLENWRQRPYADEAPFERQRINSKQREANRQATEILGWVRSAENDLMGELRALATSKQLAQGDPPPKSTPLERLDGILKYVVLGIGICLLVGLFTRLASLGGALFLLSLIMTIPPWEVQPETIANLPFDPFYFWMTEFVALLALMTTQVGRWGGLDWFVHNLLVAGCCRPKETSGASEQT